MQNPKVLAGYRDPRKGNLGHGTPTVNSPKDLLVLLMLKDEWGSEYRCHYTGIYRDLLSGSTPPLSLKHQQEEPMQVVGLAFLCGGRPHVDCYLGACVFDPLGLNRYLGLGFRVYGLRVRV